MHTDGNRRICVEEPGGVARGGIGIRDGGVGRDQGVPDVYRAVVGAAEVGPGGGGRVSYGIGVVQDVPAADWDVRADVAGVWSSGDLFNGDVEADRGVAVI